ncbi:hypothetical protein F511_08843 [Dorcoceras hygrometricum]|uniref:Uncharacterized protein n=1 Tax=Dorcoceras hygrometricum TaxID=472368 RepID=A0A2Z7ANV4_9LAMI|nr:hypothetical protein F511_08843 [Dorcoceras hygrometricum]
MRRRRPALQQWPARSRETARSDRPTIAHRRGSINASVRPAVIPAAQQGAHPAAREAADLRNACAGRRDKRAHPSVSVDRPLAQPLAHVQPSSRMELRPAFAPFA